MSATKLKNSFGARAQLGDLEDTTTALGTFQPRDFVDVGTQVSGQLRRVFVQIGDTVAQGQLLAEIDPTIYITRVDAGRAQLQNLHAQLTEKQAQFALAKEQYERQTRMRRAQATSEEAYQSAETAWKTTQAQIAQLRAQIQQVESNLRGDEANLGYTRIHAPMSGTVVSQPARQGQTLNASQLAPVILRIADLSTMTVWTQVSEADVNKLRIGQDVYFTTLGQPDRRWYGNLHQILPTPEVINNVVLYDALFDVPNPDGSLGIQMSAQVFFVHDSVKDAILIPAAFFLHSDGAGRALMIGSVLLVLIVELLNSAIEAVVDRVSPEDHPLAKRAKDIGSAAVFLSLINVPVVWALVLFG